MEIRNIRLAAGIFGLLAAGMVSAQADKLDDIIASGTLRCAVTLDFPPMGSRDASNKPIGFDVDYCNDLGKVLGVTVEIVETPFPDRIPALISDRADVGVASTSDTLERAKTIGFSIPYMAFTNIVLTRKDTSITTYDSLKGKKVGGVVGVYEALALEKSVNEWKDPAGSFRAYQSQADVLLALSQGQIDATVAPLTVASATIKEGKFPAFKTGGAAPYLVDYTSLIALRSEQGFLNYLNLFLNQQVRTGRFKELFDKWIGEGAAPDLTVPGVYR